MASDNNLSSFFLLILIALAIYYILNYDGFNSLDKFTNNLQEDFSDNAPIFDNTQPIFDNSQSIFDNSQPIFNNTQPIFDNTQPIFDNTQPIFDNSQPIFDNTQPISNNIIYETSHEPYETSHEPYETSHESYVTSHEPYETSNEPYVPQSMITDIISEQQPIYNNSESINLDSNYLDSSHLDSSHLDSSHLDSSHLDYNVHNFEPNDQSELGISGSNLDDAFAAPIPYGATTDTIDFKKQNMDNYNARDFLPKEVNDEWFETDFSLSKYQLNDDKLINTDKYIIGINTVGQSLKNASWDIRGTIPNPKLVVSPWNNSTYEPDFNLKPLC